MIPETQSATSTGYKHEATASPRILIVEDELLVAWHLESLSREQNLEVCGIVPDGVGAIEQASDLDVDLILMDIRLAGRMDGIEATRELRALSASTPIVLMTGFTDSQIATAAHEAGANAVLAKPVEARGLLKIVEHFVHCSVTQR